MGEWEVERVLNHRLVKRGRKTKVELLIFVDYGPEHNLWQDDVENCVNAVAKGCCQPVLPKQHRSKDQAYVFNTVAALE